MTIQFASNIEALNRWRSMLLGRLGDFKRLLIEHQLCDEACAGLIDGLHQRLNEDKVVVAFVAEYSRGKSELINAILFADAGRRLLPVSTARTSMCSVELAYDANVGPSLALLPIESRLDGSTISEHRRGSSQAWIHMPLQGDAAEQLADTVAQLTRTQWVDRDKARALGLWDDERPGDNPAPDAKGCVEIPLWRHALVNYPHPLLQSGLVVIDTPGINALGAEPELTLDLLPSAQATVLVLAADTGVTPTDLALWRNHLGTHSLAHYVVLNKTDTLRDPLLTPAQFDQQVEALRQATARALEIDPQRVFPLSARDALTARINGDARGLEESRLPEFELALGSQLLRQRHAFMQGVVNEVTRQLYSHASRRLGEQQRQVNAQAAELRALRGTGDDRLRLARQRAAAEAAEFEQCVVQVQALRAVHGRMLKQALDLLSSDGLRTEMRQMQQVMRASLLNLGVKKAFSEMCARLNALLSAAQSKVEEIHSMLGASYARLNAEFGFGLMLAPPPSLHSFASELDLIEDGYAQYLGLTQALRLSQPQFMEPFRRMLLSKLRVVFESASVEVELWNKTASALLDTHLGERRRSFRRRGEALERIESATGELEHRIAEIDAQAERLDQLEQQLDAFCAALRTAAPPEMTEVNMPAATEAGDPRPARA